MKSSLETMRLRFTGVSDLIHHQGTLANPLNPAARRIKALSSKRKKTDEDLVDLAKAEWQGSLYWDEKFGPVVPTDNILATITAGAKKSKYGKEVGLAVFVEGDGKTGDAGVIRLDYQGPRTKEKMWADGNSNFVFTKLVRVNQSRIVRTRPIFPVPWVLEFLLKFDANVVNGDALLKSAIDAGFYIGLCDWRPRYGRFEVEVLP
jgi:hypothetical protein